MLGNKRFLFFRLENDVNDCSQVHILSVLPSVFILFLLLLTVGFCLYFFLFHSNKEWFLCPRCLKAKYIFFFGLLSVPLSAESSHSHFNLLNLFTFLDNTCQFQSHTSAILLNIFYLTAEHLSPVAHRSFKEPPDQKRLYVIQYFL